MLACTCSTIFSQASLSLVYIEYGALDVSDEAPNDPPDRAPRKLVKHALELFSALYVFGVALDTTIRHGT
jgi:hypothetical protein